MKGDAVIIQVALNETVTPAVHRRVPQSASQCAADARRCADASATIAHWHAVDAAGVQRLADADLYGQALDEMAGRILGYPSYPTDCPDTVDARLGHCLTLRHRNSLELAPSTPPPSTLSSTTPSAPRSHRCTESAFCLHCQRTERP